MTRVLGVWKPFGTDELDGADLLQIAFLYTDCVPNTPLENSALAARLKSVMDKALPIPAKALTKPLQGSRVGMVTRSFRAPPDLLSVAGNLGGAQASAPDPFAVLSENQPKTVIKTAGEALRSLGIPFPEGASASFSPALGMLVVTNIPANLDLVEGMLELSCNLQPKAIAFTTHILQAEGSVMRQLLKESNGIADHTEVWKKAEQLVAKGEATVLSTQRVETRSGQRCTIEAVEEHRFVNSFAKNEKGLWSVGFEMRPVGSRLEIDPVLGPDGYTIDLNLAPEYHHAPPTLPSFDASAPAGTYNVQLLLPVFHVSKLTTSITTGSGMTRLLGVWKPEGKPEFDHGDVLQTAFIRADVVHMDRRDP
jgi:hypothetical protein